MTVKHNREQLGHPLTRSKLKECEAICKGKAATLKLIAAFPINAAPAEPQGPQLGHQGNTEMEPVSV